MDISTENLTDLIAAAKKGAFLAESLFHLQGNRDAGAIGIILRNAICRAENDLTAGQLCALRDYATYHGQDWKRHLNAAWQTATADPVLQNLRNTLGPTWLDGFRLPA